MGDLNKLFTVKNKNTGALMDISVFDIAILWGSRAHELAFGIKGKAQGMLHNGVFFESVDPKTLEQDRNTGELGGYD